MFNKVFHEDNDRQIDEKEFLALNLNDVYIIDVRNNFELCGGSLDIAHNIPFSEIIQLSTQSKIPKDKIILTYCNYGNRAGKAALELYKDGFNAYCLGGYALFSNKIINKCKKI